ncbi:MAG: hypothetical protein JXR44_01085 [Thiotrichales bacterium]|nr:hypothetical protein [Thiotrichales bacterium]
MFSFRSFHSIHRRQRQQGIAVMLVVVVLAIIAALWVASKQGVIIGNFKNKAIESDFIELRQAQERLLQFMLLTPELYHGVDLNPVLDMPIGPGYFPCPDGAVGGSISTPATTDGIADWETCSTGSNPVGDPVGDASMLLWGYLPRLAHNTNPAQPFAFGAERALFYFVDRRFVLPSRDYTDNQLVAGTAINETGLFAPLTPQTIEADASAGGALTLNGAKGFIAILVDPGSDNQLNEVVRNGANFSYIIPNSSITAEDPTVDKLVALTYQQHWLPLLARRICTEKARYTSNYLNFIDRDNADGDGDLQTGKDPVYSGYTDTNADGLINQADVDVWKLTSSWFFWNESGHGKSWYEWSGVCP